MNFFIQNRSLSIAVGASLLAHGGLLAIRFAAPEAFRQKPTDPGLEVILVNAKHDQKPLKAQALAQANLDGGGNAAEGRARSPLPNMRENEDGEAIQHAQQRIENLEQTQQRLLAQITTKTALTMPRQNDLPEPKDPPPEQSDSVDLRESAQTIARSEAEIYKQLEDYNKRPKKTQITPSTTEVGYAMYYKAIQHKIEQIGTLNFPQQNDKKLYGELIVYIPIYQDGTIYQKEGGARVERGSGNATLDQAALAIVRRSAPFGRIPANMRSPDKDDVWEIVTRFKFTREDALEAELR